MTIEPKGGHVTKIAPLVYWLMVSATAGLPILIGSDLIPPAVRVCLMAVNAALAVLTGSTSPASKLPKE